MAHYEQKQFFSALSKRFEWYFQNASNILEIGSQDVNGTVRDLFTCSHHYLGIDLGIAKGVDWCIPGELLELPDDWAEVLISTECFEHCKTWQNVFSNMLRISKPGGLIVITCASFGRATHGTLDSDEYSSPFTTNYYKNIGIDDITKTFEMQSYFTSHGFEVNSKNHDLYFWGIRSEVAVQKANYFWDLPINRLARAQGQLSQAAERHTVLQEKLKKVELQRDQARNEAIKAKAEADQARNEAIKAKAEADQARNEAIKAKAVASDTKLYKLIINKLSSKMRRSRNMKN